MLITYNKTIIGVMKLGTDDEMNSQLQYNMNDNTVFHLHRCGIEASVVCPIPTEVIE